MRLRPSVISPTKRPRSRFVLRRLIDKPGLLTTETELSDAQRGFAKDASSWNDRGRDLLSVVKAVRPNVLIGTSTVPGAFTEEIVKAMHEHAPRLIILPLSNPTRLHEATPADLLKWTDGKALVATGSPFDPVSGPWGANGEDVSIDIAECNNSVAPHRSDARGRGRGCVVDEPCAPGPNRPSPPGGVVCQGDQRPGGEERDQGGCGR
ncbi:unnamed protein product, partial [Clonostachys rhizophaga]